MLVVVFCSLDDGLGFKLFHEQVGHNGAEGGFYGCPMHLLILLTSEEEIDILRQNFNSTVKCYIDIDVL